MLTDSCSTFTVFFSRGKIINIYIWNNVMYVARTARDGHFFLCLSIFMKKDTQYVATLVGNVDTTWLSSIMNLC